MYFLATIVATVCFWITIVFCVFKSIFIRRKPSQVFSVFKVRKYTVQEIAEKNYNIDLCGYPHEEEEILPPKELIQQYQEKRASLNADIDRILGQITDILGISITEEE